MSGWITKKLGEIGAIIRGKGIRRSETISKGMPCIRYGEIYTSYDILLDEPHSFVTKEIFDACPHIEHGDVVFTLTGENKEEIAKTLAYLGNEEIAAGGDLAIWKGHGFNAKFLAYVMNSPQLLKAKALASNGDIIVHASLKKMAEIPIPIPPLAEQKRIVAKIHAAFEKIDRLKANAEKNLANAKELFQSTLDEAMRPKNGWVEKRLGEVCETITDGDHQPPPKVASGVPFLVISDVSKGYLSFENTRFVPESYYSRIPEAKKPKKGDVLLTVTGSFGIPVLVDTEKKFCFQRHIALLRTNQMIPRFLVYQLSSHESFKYFDKVATGTAQRTVSLSSLRTMEIVLPPSAEQKRIVEKIGLLEQTLKALQQNYAQQIADCAEMRQAILREAFEGRL